MVIVDVIKSIVPIIILVVIGYLIHQKKELMTDSMRMYPIS